MKKFLVVLLACVMVFAFASSAFAADEQIADFTDVADQSYAAQVAIYRLAALGVLEGYGDGTYLPNNNITRAELTKIAVYLSGKSDMKGLMQAAIGQFSDVTSAHWANGWINIASQDGVVQGYPGGYFGPERQITQAEVITMILRIVGYTDTLNGEWPYDYLRAADTLGILDDITLRSLASTQDGSAPATRAEVAILANAVLELDVVKYDANSISYVLTPDVYDQDATRDKTYRLNLLVSLSNDNKFVATGYDLLNKAFDAVAYDGFRFQSADFDGLYYENAAWGYENFKDGELLVYAYKDYEYLDGKYYSAFDIASKYYIMGSDFPGLENALANVIVQDGEVIFIEKTSTEALVDEVKKATSGRSVVLDGETVRYANTDDDWLTEAFYGTDRAEYGKAYLDKDGDVYDFVDYEYDHKYTTTQNAVIHSVQNAYLYGERDPGLLPDADIVEDIEDDEIFFNFEDEIALDDAEDYVVYKDGEFVEMDDIEIGDVVYVMDLTDLRDGKFLVVKSLEEAELNDARVGELKLDDVLYKYFGILNEGAANGFDPHYDSNLITEYTLAGVGSSLTQFADRDRDGYTALDSAFDEKVLYGMSYDFTKLAYVIADTEVPATLGVVLDWDTTGNNEKLSTITLFNADGKEVDYSFAGTAYYGDAAAKDQFQIGDLVELDLNKDGKIRVSSNVAQISVLVYDNAAYVEDTLPLAGPAGGGFYTILANVMNGTADSYTVSRSKNLVFGDNEVSLQLDADATIFDVRVNDKGRVSDVRLIKPADVLDRDFYGGELVLYNTNSSGKIIEEMYVINGDISYAENIGIASKYFYNKTKDLSEVTIDGTVYYYDGELEIMDTAVGTGSRVALVHYSLRSSAADNKYLDDIQVLVSTNTSVPMILGGLDQFESYWNSQPVVGQVLETEGKSIGAARSSVTMKSSAYGLNGNQTYYFDEDTVAYNIKDNKALKIGDLTNKDIDKNAYVYMVIGDDDFVDYIVVIEDPTNYSFFYRLPYGAEITGSLTNLEGLQIGVNKFGEINDFDIPNGAALTFDGDVTFADSLELDEFPDGFKAIFKDDVTMTFTGLTFAGKVTFIGGSTLDNGTFYAKEAGVETDNGVITAVGDFSLTLNDNNNADLYLDENTVITVPNALGTEIAEIDTEAELLAFFNWLGIDLDGDTGVTVKIVTKSGANASALFTYGGVNWNAV